MMQARSRSVIEDRDERLASHLPGLSGVFLLNIPHRPMLIIGLDLLQALLCMLLTPFDEHAEF